eukprot:8688385-Pyramimonas_sp.AAC.1
MRMAFFCSMLARPKIAGRLLPCPVATFAMKKSSLVACRALIFAANREFCNHVASCASSSDTAYHERGVS